ncbi:MAG: polysaccharide biosynthesis tyrosine autokinase [Sedimentisphaerales bacterium]|nr:polysaccharide biosynthesis tyrosine autokinase [Sedimentisphaerales bacterium]
MSNLDRYEEQPVQGQVIQYEPSPEQPQGSALDMVWPVLRRWPVIVLTCLVISGIGVPTILFLMPKTYDTEGAVRIAPVVAPIIYDIDTQLSTMQYESYKNTQAELISSNTVLNRAVDEIMQTVSDAFPREVTPVTALRMMITNGTIEVNPERRTELMKIRMTSPEPGKAERIVDALIKAYMAEVVFKESSMANQNLKILEDRQKVLMSEIQNLETTIRSLLDEFGTGQLTPRQEMMLQQVASLRGQLISVSIQRMSLEARLATEQNSSDQGAGPTDMMERRNAIINSDPLVQNYHANVQRYEQLLLEAEESLTESNPEFQRRKQTLDTFRGRLEKRRQEVIEEFDKNFNAQVASNKARRLTEIQNELKTTIKYEENLNGQVAKLDSETIGIGRKQVEIDSQQEQLARKKEMYNEVSRRIEEIKVESQRPARITTAYSASSIPATGKRIKLAGALGAGSLGLGVLFALLLAKADTKLHRPDEIVKRVGVRIIGTTTSPKDVDQRLLGQQLNDDYQTIRANLGLFDGQGETKIIAVTSPSSADGKTTCSINLATSFTQTGDKVLLIDGDLRKPDVATVLNLPGNSRGLQDYLFGKDLKQAIIKIPSSGLYVLAADDRNASDALDLIRRPVTVERIKAIVKYFDHVIIDTPPVLAFADALVWAKMADATILSSFVGHTSQPDLREAILRLEQVGVRVLGTVVNNVKVGHSYRRYGYGYGYGEYGRQKQKRKRDSRLLLASSMIDGQEEEAPQE